MPQHAREGGCPPKEARDHQDRALIAGRLPQEARDLKDPGVFEGPCFSGKQSLVL